MIYFGYGSNLLAARIERRLGPCERLGAASLAGYVLRFHKRGGDGSGKGDAFRTGDPGDRLWGALFHLDEGQLAKLDRIEGPGYERRTVQVLLGERGLEADLYAARPEARVPGLPPFDWYKGAGPLGRAGEPPAAGLSRRDRGGPVGGGPGSGTGGTQSGAHSAVRHARALSARVATTPQVSPATTPASRMPRHG